MPTFDPIPIVWDGGHVIAVDKPADLSTQAPPGGDSLESRLRTQLAGRTDYLAMVHRLDRSVGGIMLVALRRKEARLISEQFAARRIQKRYGAWVFGTLDQSETVWRDYLRKVPQVAKAEVCDPNADGAKEAQTRVEPVALDPTANASRVSLFPITGRMHQLRVQCASRGHPIIGDPVYADPQNGRLFPGGESPQRLLLRAESIEFHDPRNGKRTTVGGGPLPPLAAIG